MAQETEQLESVQQNSGWDDYDQAMFDQGVDDFFDIYFKKIEEGVISFEHAENFIERLRDRDPKD